MLDSVSTPYDIADIPHIPWQPGLREWILLALGLLLVTLAVRWRTARYRRRSKRGIVKLLLSDIESAAKAGTARDIERISHLARRIVEFVSGTELSMLSPREMTKLAEASSSQSLHRTLTELASLEELVYEPPSLEHDKTATESATRLAEALHAYVREQEARKR